jgi:hypothetical protein
VEPHPFQLAGKRALAGAFFLALLLQPLGCFCTSQGVVALVGNALAAVELQDPAGDVVEEVAVVGDHA